jgi:hypothetical protein
MTLDTRFEKASEIKEEDKTSPRLDAWTRIEARSEEEKWREPDVCPHASRPQFSLGNKDPVWRGPDTVRYCLSGKTCSCFRVKPFEDCPTYPRVRKR